MVLQGVFVLFKTLMIRSGPLISRQEETLTTVFVKLLLLLTVDLVTKLSKRFVLILIQLTQLQIIYNNIMTKILLLLQSLPAVLPILLKRLKHYPV